MSKGENYRFENVIHAREYLLKKIRRYELLPQKNRFKDYTLAAKIIENATSTLQFIKQNASIKEIVISPDCKVVSYSNI